MVANNHNSVKQTPPLRRDKGAHSSASWFSPVLRDSSRGRWLESWLAAAGYRVIRTTDFRRYIVGGAP